MSLKWKFTEEAHERRMDKYPPIGTTMGEEMNPVTELIIMFTMSVGIGDLTEATAGEFYARLKVLESIDGPFLLDSEGEPREFTPEMITDHIGLSTNVPYRTADAWAVRLMEGRLRTLRHNFRSETGLEGIKDEVYYDPSSGPEPVTDDQLRQLRNRGLVTKQRILNEDGEPGERAWVFDPAWDRTHEEVEQFEDILGY